MTVPEEMAAEAANKRAEREALRGVIQQWNANRLDLFELSEPNEDLEFHGVMRFYFQDSGQKVATKCIRVASDATSQAVIETLIEKFRPDMRMLSVPEYALYEIHENGEERKLGLEEKPLLVQLNWHIDDREGRFLLRRIDDKTNAQGVGFGEGTSFRRKLSKREKKQMKKQEKLSRLKSAEQDENTAPVDQNGVAEKLYTELPETSFTRSISNPEAVMRRRRQQKLERKLQQFRSKDGGPDTGGTLKIYGEALCKDVPYKTLLLSVRDSAAQVVREMLAKYGLDKVDPQQYCLVQVNNENASGNPHQEYILDDDECPLAILMNHPSTRGSIMFHVKRKPADYVPRKRKKKPTGKWNEFEHRYDDDRLPFLVELNPDGTDINNGTGVRHRLQPNVTEVGSDRPIGPQAVQAQTLTLAGPTVMPRHCVIAFTENIVTLTPCSRDAHTYVNNQRIHQTTILQNGAIIKFGRLHTFRFIDPAPEDRIRQRQDASRQMNYEYDRRSPDMSNQDTNSEKYRSGSGTPNDGPGSNPPSPTKSSVASPRSPTHSAHPPEGTHNYETTFDLDGNVETASLTSSRDGNRLSQQYERQPRGTDPILPAVMEFLEETEETFLHAVITDVDPSTPQFKLAPTYTLYLAARYRASTHFRPELQRPERAKRLEQLLATVAAMIQNVIRERYMDASSLALWLANGSELLHMLKSDRHIGPYSLRAQEILADSVQNAFASLVGCVSLELAPAMLQFMADADEPAKEAGVLQIFSNTMALLRCCRVNAALTIQLFSHLFHAINATAFNTLISNGNLCVRWFGRRLKARLYALETWAERQGLELASQCHLATIMQATHLLQAPKYNAEELATLSSSCFKLNSLQVRALLQKYQPAADEPRLPAELIENVVRVAESVADALARGDRREIRLEEEPTLALALLLPDDGYSCEIIRGVPPGLAEFLAPLINDGICKMAPQPTSSGFWTIYMIDPHNNFRSPSAMSNRSGGYSGGHVNQIHGQPEIQIIKLHKSTNGMGLSIVAAKGTGQDRLGIYIKSVVAGGAADADGRLTAGDQLLKVDGQSLVGVTQEKAAEFLVRTGPIVTLEVAKKGAIYHGLATLLSQPSPVMTRGPRRMSERDLPSRLGHEPPHGQIHSSKSVPALHNVGTSDGKQPHEVFNPGYSRASSSNSVTPPVQPPPMPAMNGATSLRSRSSHNLHDPMRMGTLPPSGLVSRQQSSPNLTPSQVQGNVPANLQSNDTERFYQNLSVYRHQDPTMKQQPSPPQPLDDRNSSNLHTQKNLRGSQNSLNRPTTDMSHQTLSRDRPISAYIPQGQQGYNMNQMPLQMQQPPRSQSSRDIIRQEAKLQEMQEEVRRRELRGGMPGPPVVNNYRPNTNYLTRPTTAAQAANAMRPARPAGSTPNLAPNSPNYNYLQFGQFNQYGQFNNKQPMQQPQQQQQQQQHQFNQYAVVPKKGDPARTGGQSHSTMDMTSYGNDTRQVMEHNRQFGNHYSNGTQYSAHQNGAEGSVDEVLPPARPVLPDDAGYRESPPPPPLNTSTHPLYTKPTDTGYTASMQDPPRGGYYPAPGAPQQTRQYQYSATNPWQREEREKEQARRREAARLWRDQQIAELSSSNHRTSQQEEQLRALQLERDFQKRAEEAANQQDDDDESNDLENESTQRVQGLLRMAAANQERNNQNNQQNTLSRTNANNQSLRGQNLPQSVGSQLQSTSVPLHTVSSQQGVGQNNSGNIYMGQNESPANINMNQIQNSNAMGQNPISPNYNQQMGGPPSKSLGQLTQEERERQKKIEEYKRKQTEFDESQRKREEEIRQQQMYHKNQQQLHPGMLRLDNLVINGPSSPTASQNGNNDAPPPPERGSSYAVMSQQSVLRSNTNSTNANTPVGSHQTSTIKRVSFHDPNANIEQNPRNAPSIISSTPSSIMDTIREDPNNFINDAENLLASPKTPEGPGGPFGTATPGVIGAQEYYRDPRTKRLAEKQKQQLNAQLGEVPEKLSFKEKMKMFAMETGEDGTPRDKVKISRAQREIDNIGSPLNSTNNNNRS